MSTSSNRKSPSEAPTMDEQSQPILVDDTTMRIHRQQNNSSSPPLINQLVPATQSNHNNNASTRSNKPAFKYEKGSPSNGAGDVIEQEEDNYLYNFPPGYRFAPKDEELTIDYLQKKVLDQKLAYLGKIPEVNLYEFNPKELSDKYVEIGEKEWYFFTPRERKYPNGQRPKRAAGNGYWKATGADKKVYYKNQHVGYRKALVYYQGKPPKGEKTQWIMHEFRLIQDAPRQRKNAEDMRLDEWVLCRIYHKEDKSGKDSEEAKENSADDANPVPEPEEYSEDNMTLATIPGNISEANNNIVQDSSPVPYPLTGYPASAPEMPGNYSMSPYMRCNTQNFQCMRLQPPNGPTRPNQSCMPSCTGCYQPCPRTPPIQALQWGSLPYNRQVNVTPASFNQEPSFTPSEPLKFNMDSLMMRCAATENFAMLNQQAKNCSSMDNNAKTQCSAQNLPVEGLKGTKRIKPDMDNVASSNMYDPPLDIMATMWSGENDMNNIPLYYTENPPAYFREMLSDPDDMIDCGYVHNSYESSDQLDYQGGQEYSPDVN